MRPRVALAALVSFSAALPAGSAMAADATQSRTYPAYPLEIGGEPHTVTVSATAASANAADSPATDAALRTYQLQSTAPQREQAPQQRTLTERAGELQTRTGNLLFDALVAQALDDARLDSVSSIRDFAYNDDQPIACECFQTGAKWTYVWTRDTSYSTDLGLALLDPARAVNSLRFKISGFRDGVTPPAGLPADSLQIVQDTGSGGSWPVSSDRLTWALGAGAALDQLAGAARAAFAAETYRALRGSLAADHAAIFDASDGLYTGEQSFLDWREQTYAPYVVKDLTQIAQSKSLSTNVAHYAALRLAARLATEQHDRASATRYTQQADALKLAINRVFWLPERGLYASITTSDAHAAPVAKFDMLGEALAIVYGVADEQRAREVLAHYPHAPFGVPVYYPMQPGIPVYHNRAIWPFVTAYALEAAARVRNTAVADNAFDSLTRSAALYLTNTENLEWLTGRSQFDDGPVVNSTRQIWSVAGYVAMVSKVVFGFQPGAGGVRIAPFLTTHMRDTLGGDTATLSNLRYQGRVVRVVLHLPAAAGGANAAAGYYPVSAVTLNGRPVAGDIAPGALQADNVIEIRFGAATPGDARIRMVAPSQPLSHDDPQVYSPPVPEIEVAGMDASGANSTAGTRITITPHAPDRRYDIWRDGVRVARGISDASWSDTAQLEPGVRHCYRVVARYTASDNASHPSLAACINPAATQTVRWDDTNTESLPGTAAGGPDYRVRGVHIPASGRYALSLTYDNHDFAINTGVTNAVKRLALLDAHGREVASAIVQMPHIGPEGDVHPLRQSTEARLQLLAGEYTLLVSDYFNMSYLASNVPYREIGGKGGARNRATISALQIARLP